MTDNIDTGETKWPPDVASPTEIHLHPAFDVNIRVPCIEPIAVPPCPRWNAATTDADDALFAGRKTPRNLTGVATPPEGLLSVPHKVSEVPGIPEEVPSTASYGAVGTAGQVGVVPEPQRGRQQDTRGSLATPRGGRTFVASPKKSAFKTVAREAPNERAPNTTAPPPHGAATFDPMDTLSKLCALPLYTAQVVHVEDMSSSPAHYREFFPRSTVESLVL